MFAVIISTNVVGAQCAVLFFVLNFIVYSFHGQNDSKSLSFFFGCNCGFDINVIVRAIQEVVSSF